MDSITKIYLTEVSDLHKNAVLISTLMDSFRNSNIPSRVLTGTVLIVGEFDELTKFQKHKSIVSGIVKSASDASGITIRLTGFEKDGKYSFRVDTNPEEEI